MVSVSGCWDGLPHACCDAMMLIKERDGPLWTALLYNVTGLAERQGRRQKLGGVGGGEADPDSSARGWNVSW